MTFNAFSTWWKKTSAGQSVAICAVYTLLDKTSRRHSWEDAAWLPPSTLPTDRPIRNEIDHYLITHPLMHMFSMYSPSYEGLDADSYSQAPSIVLYSQVLPE
jgi:hypothetical protein